jgi:hypothetical protein
MKIKGLCVLTAILSLAVPLIISAADIVKNGKAAAEIVIPADAPKGEQTAAKELQMWVREITGAELPIINQETTEKNLKIKLGKSLAGKHHSCALREK